MSDHYRGAPGCACHICQPHLRGLPVPVPSADPAASTSSTADNVVQFPTDEAKRQHIKELRKAVNA